MLYPAEPEVKMSVWISCYFNTLWYARSEGSGETVRLRRLTWAFTALLLYEQKVPALSWADWVIDNVLCIFQVLLLWVNTNKERHVVQAEV